MQQTLTYQTDHFHVHIVVEKMAFLIIHLLGMEKVNSGGRGNKICTHYGFTNHTVNGCYRKHGYPIGHKYHKPQRSINQ